MNNAKPLTSAQKSKITKLVNKTKKAMPGRNVVSPVDCFKKYNANDFYRACDCNGEYLEHPIKKSEMSIVAPPAKIVERAETKVFSESDKTSIVVLDKILVELKQEIVDNEKPGILEKLVENVTKKQAMPAEEIVEIMQENDKDAEMELAEYVKTENTMLVNKLSGVAEKHKVAKEVLDNVIVAMLTFHHNIQKYGKLAKTDEKYETRKALYALLKTSFVGQKELQDCYNKYSVEFIPTVYVLKGTVIGSEDLEKQLEVANKAKQAKADKEAKMLAKQIETSRLNSLKSCESWKKPPCFLDHENPILLSDLAYILTNKQVVYLCYQDTKEYFKVYDLSADVLRVDKRFNDFECLDFPLNRFHLKENELVYTSNTNDIRPVSLYLAV